MKQNRVARASLGGIVLVAIATATAPLPASNASPAHAAQASSGVSAARTIEFSGPTMGATFMVKVVASPGTLEQEARLELEEAITGILDRVDRLMSTWDPSSELSGFNASRSLTPIPLSHDTMEVFRWASTLSNLTGGALDPTVGPLVEAWGFGPGGRPDRAPSDERIAMLRLSTGMDLIELDTAARTARKTRPDVQCDFSSLAPGYAADLIWEELSRRGLRNFVVDISGELRTRGHNAEGKAWQVAIDRPERGRVTQRIVPVSNLAIATSGDYRNYYEQDGRRLTHILDPRTGRPLAHRLASVTVIDDLAVRADGLATALMVLGSEEGMALARKLDLAALFIIRTDNGFAEMTTPRFEALIRDQPSSDRNTRRTPSTRIMGSDRFDRARGTDSRHRGIS